MDENTTKVLLATVPAAISSLVTWLVTRQTDSRFYAQRWWDKRSEVYQSLLSSLATLHFTESEWLPILRGQVRSSPEYSETLNSKFRTALADLKLYRGTGGFIISEIAGDAVERLLKHLDSEAQDPSIDTCEMNLEAMANCRQIVMIEARAALKLDD